MCFVTKGSQFPWILKLIDSFVCAIVWQKWRLIQWWILYFSPDRERQPLRRVCQPLHGMRQPITLAIFPENFMKLKNKLHRQEDCESLAPPLNPPVESILDLISAILFFVLFFLIGHAMLKFKPSYYEYISQTLGLTGTYTLRICPKFPSISRTSTVQILNYYCSK